MQQTRLLVLVMGAIALFGHHAFAQMPTIRAVTVEARTMEAPSTITLVGTVESLRQSQVGSEIEGRVQQMPGREGDLIEAGGVICRLDDITLQLRLREEKARLAGLGARHDELVAGTRKQELVRLAALRDEAAARFDRWAFEMERIEKLYAGRESNDKEYHETRAEFIAGQRRKIATEAAYKLGVEGPRKETIAQAAYAVAEQQAIVDRIESDIGKTVIRAPFTGHIVARAAEVGEWLSVGDQVVNMADLSAVLVRVDVPEYALPYLAVGDTIRVFVDALGRSFDGRLRLIVRQADLDARTFPIAIIIDNKESLLAGGMFARATVPSGPSERVLAVPQDALVEKVVISFRVICRVQVVLVISREGVQHQCRVLHRACQGAYRI